MNKLHSKNRHMHRFAISFLFMGMLFPGVQVMAESTAIVEKLELVNPGFEIASKETDASSPVEGWTVSAYFQDGRSTLELDREMVHSGQASLKIVNQKENDVRLVQVVPVQSETFYRAQAFVKTEGVGNERIGANLSLKDIPFTPQDLKGTSDGWQPIETYIRTEKNVTELELTVGLGGYGSANIGTIWLDDLTFEALDSMPADVPFISYKNKEEQQRLNEEAKRNAESQVTANTSSNGLYVFTFLAMAGLAFGIYWLTRKPTDEAETIVDSSTVSGNGEELVRENQPSSETEHPSSDSSVTKEVPMKRSVFYEEER